MSTNPSQTNPNPAIKKASSRLLRNAAQVLVTSAVFAGTASAEPMTSHWVDTWTASVQPIWAADALPLAKDIPDSLADSTVRQIVRASIGGDRLRIVLSNEYGTTPLMIGGVQVAKLVDETSDVDRSTNRIVTFGGRETTTIPARARMVSDPVAVQLAPLARLSVSLYLPERTLLTTFHWDGRQRAAVAAGNRLASGRFADPSMLDARLFLSDVLVDARRDTRTVVALGDSITDGRGATIDADRRWTDYLARRLADDHTAVLNAGISGARMLSDGMGVNALARLDRDVLSRPGVQAVVVLLGTNDIGWPGSSFAPHDAPMTAQAIIDGYRQLIERAHMRGIRVVGGTIAPFEGALEGTPIHGYYTADKDDVRRQVNAWIRESGAFDAVADFDAVLRDPAHPARMLPHFDCGDHLHPNDAGDAAMAAAVTPGMLFGQAGAAALRLHDFYARPLTFITAFTRSSLPFRLS
jgi:lysophospholipase L1-like esterase